MHQVVKSILGAGAMLAITAKQASAEVCLLFICVGGGTGGGGTPEAPEIDVAQGFAALAILACAALLLRERFLRQRGG
jgi:hypothetical protein